MSGHKSGMKEEGVALVPIGQQKVSGNQLWQILLHSHNKIIIKMKQRKTSKKATLISQDNFMAKQTGGSNDPPPVSLNVQTTIRFRYTPRGVPIWTPRDILQQIPGNWLTGDPEDSVRFFIKMRLIKFQIWNPNDLGDNQSLAVYGQFKDDPRTFQDVGIRGAKSSSLHLRPPLSLLQTWFSYTDASTSLMALPRALNEDHIVHLTVEVVGQPSS